MELFQLIILNRFYFRIIFNLKISINYYNIPLVYYINSDIIVVLCIIGGTMRNKRNIYTLIMTFLAMFLFAITDGARGIFIPTFKETFGVGDASVGIMFTMSSFAYLIGTYIGSIICPKIGQKLVIMAGTVIAGISFFLASHAMSFTHLIICYIGANIGFSIMSIGMNTLIPLMPVLYLGVLMNLLHFFYGFGSTISQRFTGLILSMGISWREILLYFSWGYVALFILYLFVKPPQSHISTQKKSVKIKNYKLLIAASICLALYVAAEIQTANWLFNYYKFGLHIDTNKGSLYVSLFFAFFSVGRLFGGFIAEKIGYLRSITITMIISIILYTTGLIMGTAGVYIIAVSGLFFSIVFPTLILVIQQMFPKSASKATGIATMSSAIMTTSSGIGIGLANDYFGVVPTMYFIPLVLILSTIAMAFIVKYNTGHVIE